MLCVIASIALHPLDIAAYDVWCYIQLDSTLLACLRPKLDDIVGRLLILEP